MHECVSQERGSARVCLAVARAAAVAAWARAADGVVADVGACVVGLPSCSYKPCPICHSCGHEHHCGVRKFPGMVVNQICRGRLSGP